MSGARKLNDADDRRRAPREKLDPINIRAFTSLDHLTLVTRSGRIVDASKTGFLLLIDRKDLVPKVFKEALSLSELEGDQVMMVIDPLNLEISGKIVRTKRIDKETYEIVIDYSDDAPEYWREALIEMLPRRADYE